MPEKRPNVFPTNTKPQDIEENVEPEKVKVDADYESKKYDVAGQVYQSSAQATGWEAVQIMQERTAEQLRLREEALKKNRSDIQSYQDKYEEMKNNKNVYTPSPVPEPEKPKVQQATLKSEPKSPLANSGINNLRMNINHDIEELSQPQFNAPFDIITLPSEGKLYKTGKATVKLAYMTTADENILTSPNLLENGKFLEILINRKLLDKGLRYKDLLVGDRNAIMIWLRATSYGNMYPIQVIDDDGEAFETEIDLSTLKSINLTVEPNEEGLFEFVLPLSKNLVKFKLLNVGDLEDIDEKIKIDNQNNPLVNNLPTYILAKQVVEINGQRDEQFIFDYINNMRLMDAKALREYIEKIDCGIDLEIEVPTPRGGSVKTFLPLNINFFWPKFRI